MKNFFFEIRLQIIFVTSISILSRIFRISYRSSSSSNRMEEGERGGERKKKKDYYLYTRCIRYRASGSSRLAVALYREAIATVINDSNVNLPAFCSSRPVYLEIQISTASRLKRRKFRQISLDDVKLIYFCLELINFTLLIIIIITIFFNFYLQNLGGPVRGRLTTVKRMQARY